MGIPIMASWKRIKLTKASSGSIESFFSVRNEKVDGGEAVQKKWNEADLDGVVKKAIKKITSLLFLLQTFWLYCLLYYWRFPLLCIKRDALCQLQINCHFHFPNFPTVSSLFHIRKILVHWSFHEKSGPQKLVVGATLALKQNFLARTLVTKFTNLITGNLTMYAHTNKGISLWAWESITYTKPKISTSY